LTESGIAQETSPPVADGVAVDDPAVRAVVAVMLRGPAFHFDDICVGGAVPPKVAEPSGLLSAYATFRVLRAGCAVWAGVVLLARPGRLLVR
jgi:hypothetical protein